MRNFLITTIFFSLLPLASVQAENPAKQDTPRTVIVLDASGSMWGQVEGKPKIQIAKNVVRDLIQGLDPSIQVGLTAYGHRRKDDCSDIEALVPVTSLNKGKFISAVDGLQPKGKTPLTRAVQQAAQELHYTESRATVILVSDGIETCDADPCSVAKSLEESGVDFTAHVIGFDIKDPTERAQLKCIADNTGGQFISANDTTSLKSALDSVVEEARSKEESGIKLVAVHTPGGKPVEDVFWKLLDSAGKTVKTGGGETPLYRLAPGTYTAKVISMKGVASAEKSVTVVADKLQEEELLIPTEGEIVLSAVNSPGGKALENVYWELFEIEPDQLKTPKRVRQGGGHSPVYRLLPGKYFVRVQSTKGKATAQKEVTVEAGERLTEEVLLAEEGRINLFAVTSTGQKPLSDVYWEIYSIPERSLDEPKRIVSGKGATPSYQLLPGRYIAKVKSTKGKASAQEEIEVLAGQAIKKEVIIPEEGEIQLIAVTQPGGKEVEGIYWRVFDIPEDPLREPTQIVAGKGDTPTYRLLPGKYRATVTSTKGLMQLESEVEVKPGERTRTEIIVPAEGKISLKAVEKDNGNSIKDAYWRIFQLSSNALDDPKQVKAGSGATPTYQLLPGKYLARVEYNKGKERAEKEVLVEAGKHLNDQIEIIVE